MKLSSLPLKAFLFAAALGLSLGPARVSAELIAYDGIDYSLIGDLLPWNSLDGRDGGFGWAGPWGFRQDLPLGKGQKIQFYSYIVDPTQDPYEIYSGPLNMTGNAAHLWAGEGSIELARVLENPIAGDAGTRTYISFIGQRLGEPANPDDEVYQDTEVYPDGYPWPNNLYPRGAALRIFNSTGGEILQIGHYSETSFSLFEDGYNTWEIAAGPIVETDEPFGELSFVVVRIDHVGDDTAGDNIYVWINPDLNAAEDTSTAQIQQENWTVTEFNSETQEDEEVPIDFSDIYALGPWAGDNSSNRPYAELFFDELRLGTTWADVTPGGATPMWAGYPISEGWVNTGDSLGWLKISLEPWIWAADVETWLYFEESVASADAGWMYLSDGGALELVAVGESGFAYSLSLMRWFYVDGSGWAYLL